MRRPRAPAAGPSAGPVDVNVCDVVKDPASFNGKMVRIKGTVVAGIDQFVIRDATDPNCGFQVNAIWLSYPEGSKAKSGPVAIVTGSRRATLRGLCKLPRVRPVTLEKDKEFKQFDSLLSQTHQKGVDMCLGCARYEVTATLMGRLDSVADASMKRDASGKIVGFGGFGNMNAYPARLVLQSVSDVTPKEIDYSKNDEETKGEGRCPTSREAAAMIRRSPWRWRMRWRDGAAGQGWAVGKAAGVYGKSKEHNGVITSIGEANEADIKARRWGQGLS